MTGSHEDEARIQRRAEALAHTESTLKVGLVELRRQHHLTQEDIAERLLVSQSRVAQFERYDSNPTLDMIMRYALAVEARITITVESDRTHYSELSTPHTFSFAPVAVPTATVNWNTTDEACTSG